MGNRMSLMLLANDTQQPAMITEGKGESMFVISAWR